MPKITREEFVDRLKNEFSKSKEYQGYDADDDQGYFIEFLIDIIYEEETGCPPST